MTTTASQLARIKKEFENISGESMQVENYNGSIYAFGSELACLRLEHKHNNRQKSYAGYSKNLNSFYFVIEN